MFTHQNVTKYKNDYFANISNVVKTWYTWVSQVIFSFFLFLNGRICGIWNFPNQGVNQSCSYSNTGYFNSLGQARNQIHASTVTWAAAVGFLTHCITEGTPCNELLSLCFLKIHSLILWSFFLFFESLVRKKSMVSVNSSPWT